MAFSLNPLDWIAGAASTVVEGAAGFAFGFLEGWVTDALSWLSGELMDRIIGAGGADVPAGLFGPGGPANVIYWLGLVSVIAGVSVQAVSTMWRRDAQLAEMTETLLDLPVTVVMMFALPAVGVTVLEVCDLVAAEIGRHAFETGFLELIELEGGIPGLLKVVVGVLLILVMLVLYVVQLVRSHLVTVLIVLGPFTIAMRSWRPARMVLEATVKLFAAMAFTPVVMMTMLAVALYRWEEAGPLDLARCLAVLAGLLLAVFSPFIANRLFPISDGLVAGIAGGAVAGGMLLAKGALGRRGGGDGGGSGGSSGGGSRLNQLVGSRSSSSGGGAGGESGSGGSGSGSGSGGSGGGSGGSGGGGSGAGGSGAGGAGAAAVGVAVSAAKQGAVRSVDAGDRMSDPGASDDGGGGGSGGGSDGADRGGRRPRGGGQNRDTSGSGRPRPGSGSGASSGSGSGSSSGSVAGSTAPR